MAAVANACRFVFWTKLATKSLRFLATNQRGTKAGFRPFFETPSWHSVRNTQRHTSLMWNLRGAIDAPRPERRAQTRRRKRPRRHDRQDRDQRDRGRAADARIGGQEPGSPRVGPNGR